MPVFSDVYSCTRGEQMHCTIVVTIIVGLGTGSTCKCFGLQRCKLTPTVNRVPHRAISTIDPLRDGRGGGGGFSEPFLQISGILLTLPVFVSTHVLPYAI